MRWWVLSAMNSRFPLASAKTFPGWVKDCEDKLYEWQMRGYMRLWDADEWDAAQLSSLGDDDD